MARGDLEKEAWDWRGEDQVTGTQSRLKPQTWINSSRGSQADPEVGPVGGAGQKDPREGGWERKSETRGQGKGSFQRRMVMGTKRHAQGRQDSV